MLKLKEITNSVWLLLSEVDNAKIGFISETKQGFSLSTQDTNHGKKFATKEEINEFYSQNLFNNVIEISSKKNIEYFIKGFPVKFTNPFEVDVENKISELPLYAKTADSKIYHCAGYYCVLFPNGWVHGYCPKYSTITNHKYSGPYRTEEEVKCVLSTLRKNEGRLII